MAVCNYRCNGVDLWSQVHLLGDHVTTRLTVALRSDNYFTVSCFN